MEFLNNNGKTYPHKFQTNAKHFHFGWFIWTYQKYIFPNEIVGQDGVGMGMGFGRRGIGVLGLGSGIFGWISGWLPRGRRGSKRTFAQIICVAFISRKQIAKLLQTATQRLGLLAPPESPGSSQSHHRPGAVVKVLPAQKFRGPEILAPGIGFFGGILQQFTGRNLRSEWKMESRQLMQHQPPTRGSKGQGGGTFPFCHLCCCNESFSACFHFRRRGICILPRSPRRRLRLLTANRTEIEIHLIHCAPSWIFGVAKG